MSNLIIAVDGPSASGKSTVSRKAAERLGCVYVDSGSFYRGLTWHILRLGLSSQDAPAVVRAMETMRMECFLDGNAVRFTIDGIDPGQALRSQSVREQVSAVAAIPAVRAWMVRHLQGMTRFGRLVMEGRDIGTVVFPDTKFKFYLAADLQERTRRRSLEIQAQEGKTDFNAVRNSLLRRDAADSGRSTAPLCIAEGAHVIDTTSMSVDDVVEYIVAVIQPAE